MTITLYPTAFYCLTCARRTPIDPEEHEETPRCGVCGEFYQCGNCGYEIDGRGHCQRAEVTDVAADPDCP